MNESGQSGRENRKEDRISEKSMRERHRKHTTQIVFKRKRFIHQKTTVIFFYGFVFYRNREKGSYGKTSLHDGCFLC